jgi:hypothetical protein
MVVEESGLAKEKGKTKNTVSWSFPPLPQRLLGLFVCDPRSLPGVVLPYRELLSEIDIFHLSRKNRKLVVAKTGAAKGPSSQEGATINRFGLLSIQGASEHCAIRIPMGRMSLRVEEGGTRWSPDSYSLSGDAEKVVGPDFLIPRTPLNDTFPLQVAS